MEGVGRIERAADEGTDVAETAERRRKRDSLFLAASVRFADAAECHDVRVRNLSEGGLMIEHARPAPNGMAVALEMRGLGALTGTVAWCTDGRIGIALDHPIDPTRARKPVGTGTTTPGYAKPLIVPTRRR